MIDQRAGRAPAPSGGGAASD